MDDEFRAGALVWHKARPDAPTSVYEIARVVGTDYPESAEPLANPWNGHVDGTLAREFGFTPAVRSLQQAAAEGIL